MSPLRRLPSSLAYGIAAAILLLGSPLPSRADLIPILDIQPGGIATEPLANAVAGWQFQVTNPITISALGVWDEGGRPLSIDHQIGLWNLNETLLATATVGNGATPVASASGEGQWLFTPIAPLFLGPGQYVLGAVWGNPSFGFGADPFRLNTASTTSFGVSLTGSRIATLLPSPILVFPSGDGFGHGIFGPNAAVSVPEPQSGLIFLVGSAALLGLLKRSSFTRTPRGC